MKRRTTEATNFGSDKSQMRQTTEATNDGSNQLWEQHQPDATNDGSKEQRKQKNLCMRNSLLVHILYIQFFKSEFMD